MGNISWRKEYNTGIPEIDEQHQQLVEMINSLANNSEPVNIFDNVMHMSKYADDHFELEENIMLRCGCDALKEHREKHLQFRQKVSELAGLDYTTGEHKLDAFTFLCNWLINHILTMDMQYKDCFVSNFHPEDKPAPE